MRTWAQYLEMDERLLYGIIMLGLIAPLLIIITKLIALWANNQI